MKDPKFLEGNRVTYHGLIATVTEVLLVDRDTPKERFKYRIESDGENRFLVEEKDIFEHQERLF